MVTEDAEGDLLQSIRGAIGPGVPIAITLDLHANVSPCRRRAPRPRADDQSARQGEFFRA